MPWSDNHDALAIAIAYISRVISPEWRLGGSGHVKSMHQFDAINMDVFVMDSLPLSQPVSFPVSPRFLSQCDCAVKSVF